MRRWVPLVAGGVFIGLAWAADRWLVAAQVDASAMPDRTAVLVFTSLATRVGFAIGAVALGWLVLRMPRDRLAGVAMLAVGLYFSVVLSLNVLTIGPGTVPIQLPLFLDAHDGYLLRWAGTLVTLLGLVTVVRPDRSQPSEPAAEGPMRAWWPLVASLAVIGLSYPAGVLGREAFIDMAGGEFGGPLLVEGLIRFATLSALIGIGWLVLRGPRSRLVGGLMAAAGFYVAAVVPLALAWFWMGDPATGDIREPLFIPFGIDPADRSAVGINPLSATIIAALGLATLVWPTRSRASVDRVPTDEGRSSATQVGEA